MEQGGDGGREGDQNTFKRPGGHGRTALRREDLGGAELPVAMADRSSLPQMREHRREAEFSRSTARTPPVN
jgi:hypothetical protein